MPIGTTALRVSFRPVSDTYADEFTAYGGSTGSLWEVLSDGAIYNDSTYIKTNATGGWATFMVAITATAYPKSCGYSGAIIEYRAKKNSSSDNVYGRAVIRRTDASSAGAEMTQQEITTLIYDYYGKTTLPISQNRGELIKLNGCDIGVRRGKEDKKNPYPSAPDNYTDHIYISNIKLICTIYFDGAAPSPPASIHIGGFLIQDNSLHYMYGASTHPSLSLKYVDMSNATYNNTADGYDGYDETSYVEWFCGTIKNGSTITGTVFNSKVATIGSLNSFVTIPYPASTGLESNKTYYFKCRVYDANENISAWSTIFSCTGFGEYPWWNDNWTRRKKVVFGTNHSLLAKGYTVRLPFNSGVFKTIATNGHINEAIQHSGHQIIRKKDKTFFTWRSQDDAHCYVAYYDHNLNTISSIVSLHAGIDASDTHDYSVINVDSQGYIHVVISRHGELMKYYKSLNTYSISFAATPIDLFNGSYARLKIDSSNNVYVFGRSYTATTGIRNWCYMKSTDGGQTFSTLKYFVFYESGAYGTTNTSIYCGGVEIDSNDRIHVVINFTDDYGSNNFHRKISYVYSDDAINWYKLDGVYAGKSVNTCNASGQVTFESAGTVLYSPNYSATSTAGPYFHTNNSGLRILPNGTIIFSCAKLPATQPQYNYIKMPAQPYVCISQNDNTFATINLYEKVGKKIWMHRHGGVLQWYYHSGSDVNVIKYYGIVKTEDEEWFGGELGEWYTLDYGNTWGFSFITRNSAYGIPMLSGVPSCYENKPELVLTRLKNIDYWNGEKPVSNFIPAGDDVRIVYGTTEIDRLTFNFWNYENTEIIFALQSTISENGESSIPYYVYYGNYLALNTMPHDPNNILRHFESYEDYEYGVNPTLNGWNTGTGVVYASYGQSMTSHTNKIYAGDRSLDLWTTTSFTERSMPTYYKYFEYMNAHWNQNYTYTDDSFITYFYQNSSLHTIGTVNNYSFEIGASNPSLPSLWDTFGTVERVSSKYANGSWSCKLNGFGNEAKITSNIFNISTGQYIKYKVDAFCSYSVNASTNQKNYFEIQISDNSSNILATQRNYIYSTGWNSYYLGYVSKSTSQLKLNIIQASFSENNIAYIDYARWESVPVTFIFNVHKYRRLYYYDTILGTWKKYSDFQLYQKRYYKFDCVFGTNIKAYIDSNLVINPTHQEISKLNFSNINKIRLENGNSSVFYDFHVFMDWVENPPSPIATYEYIKDYTGKSNIANDIILVYTKVLRLTNLIEAVKFDTGRISQFIKGERTTYDKLAQFIKGDKPAFEKLISNVDLNKELIDNVANTMLLTYELVSRIINYTLLEKTNSEKLANLMLSDKEIINKMHQIISMDKETYDRLINVVDLDKEILRKVANILITDKEKVERIYNILFLNKEDEAFLAHFIEMNKELKSNIINAIITDKEILNKIINTLTTDKEVINEISNMIQTDKVLYDKISNNIFGDKEIISKIMNIIISDKELENKISNVISVDKPAVDRYVSLIELDKYVINKIVNGIRNDKQVLNRMQNIIEGDKFITSRFVNNVITDKIKSGEISNIILSDKEKIYSIAMDIFGDKEKAEKIANTIMLEDTLILKIVNYIATDKALTQKVINNILSDKATKRRLANDLAFLNLKFSRFSQKIDYEKTRQSRLSENITLLLVKILRIASSASFEKYSEEKISEDILLEKIISDKKMAELIDFVAIKMSLFAQDSSFIKNVYKKIAEEVQLEKTKFDNKYVQMVDFIATEMNMFSQDANFMADKLSRIAENIDFIAEVISFYRYAQKVNLEKSIINRFIEDANFRKDAENKFSGYAEFKKEYKNSYVHGVNLLKNDINAFSEIINLTANKLNRFSIFINLISNNVLSFSQNINFEKFAQSRFSENIQFIEVETLRERIAEYSEFEKVSSFRLSEFIELVSIYLPELILITNIEVK